MELERSIRYGLAGLALALVSPAALILTRFVENGAAETTNWLVAEIQRQPDVFACFGLVPLFLVVVAAFLLGCQFDRLERTALHDGLTGLWNRRYGDVRIPHEIARARREQRPLTALLIDLDHLKRINDCEGHSKGDLVLKQVAHAILGCCRQSDIALRWAGDEFVVLAPATACNDAVVLAERIRVRVATSSGWSVSIGVAQLPHDGTPATLIGAADKALYRAKESGRDMVTSIDLPSLSSS